MKKYFSFVIAALLLFSLGLVVSNLFARQEKQEGYILIHEKDIAEKQSGPHDGGGNTIAHNFFAGAEGFKLAFRKRILLPGSAIGYHLQERDEIYYIVSGKGEMTMNGKTFLVETGDAVLTRPGNSHGLKQTGKENMVVIINYQLPEK